MSHHLDLKELKIGQTLVLALEKDEGCFLNQNFPKPPKKTFWVGGLIKAQDEKSLSLDLKVFKDLATLDIDSPLANNTLSIPKENIAQSWWYCGSAILFLKTAA